MTKQAQLKKLKTAIAQGKHPMQQPLEKRQKRAEKVANKILSLVEENK